MENKETTEKKIILSGIQPTGVFTLGNYLGAVKNWQKMQEDYNCYYFIADLHSLTVHIDPTKRKQQTLQAFALLLACGIDPEKSLIFVQSHVRSHAEMGWLMSCCSQFGELSRMTQFKDKSSKHPENINAGLFTYPALMAGDILLYQADYVPVGADQTQHLEFTRDIATRFNHNYGEIFKLPEGYFPKAGARVMSLQEPTSKMSKSDTNPKATISILDEENVILKKFKSAVTDSEAVVCYREDKPGVSNLMTIYSAITGKTMAEIETEFAGKGYGDFKAVVGQTVADELKPVREKYKELMGDRKHLEELMRDGAQKAEYIARKTLSKAKKKLGLLPEIR
ncbi:MAG: tryptophan--tRNA ligase [Selenomonas sp.]|nr:tryptophan--tRNA ligase [Selenomonas sp.]